MTKYALVILISIILVSGCASTAPITKYEVSGLENSNILAIQDLRPVTESQFKGFSGNIFSKAYAIYRIGEEKTSPSPVRLLQHRIYERFGGNNGTVKVYHLVSYTNFAASFKKAAWGSAIGGVVGSVISGSSGNNKSLGVGINYIDREKFQSVDKEYKLGRYTKEENPNKSNMLFIYMDVEINDKRVFIRRIAPHIGEDAAGNKKNYYLTELDKAYEALLNEF